MVKSKTCLHNPVHYKYFWDSQVKLNRAPQGENLIIDLDEFADFLKGIFAMLVFKERFYDIQLP